MNINMAWNRWRYVMMRFFMGVLCCVALTAWAADEADLLSPEEAFRVQVQRLGDAVQVNYHIADGYYLYRDRLQFALEPALALREVTRPNGLRKTDAFFGETEIYRQRAQVNVTLPPNVAESAILVLSWQGCADVGVCYPPQTQRIALSQLTAGSSNVSPVLPRAADFFGDAPTGDVSDAVMRTGLVGVLMTFFVSGLGMALTACMYPMLPIVAAIVAGDRGGVVSRWRGFLLALSYVQGMALTYTLVGIAAGLTGRLLTVWLQQPAVILSAAGVLVIFALAMFDVVHVQVPTRFQSYLQQGSQRLTGGRVLSVFVMGALSALIIGPCVAPPLALALGYIGSTGDAWLGGAALYAMALGLGAPLVLIGTLGGHILPRAGVWMRGVKAAFGVLMLVLAVYLARPFLPLPLSLFLWGGIALGCGVFLGLFERMPRRHVVAMRLQKAVALLCVLVGAAQILGALSGATQPFQPLAGWGVSEQYDSPRPQALLFENVQTEAELEAYLQRAAGRPVVFDFYADWCVSCQEIERDILSNPAVHTALLAVERVKVDVTANTDAHQALMRRFGVLGPPALIVWNTQHQEVARWVGIPPVEALAERLLHVAS